MEKEIAQSNLPSKRKVPNTIQKYHIRQNLFRGLETIFMAKVGPNTVNFAIAEVVGH